MAVIQLMLCYLFLSSGFLVISSDTASQDGVALRSLKYQWRNTPANWANSDDPCGGNWEGVTCSNSRVTGLKLTAVGLSGIFSDGIGGLTELRSLDLSFNQGLTGPLSPRLGDLQKLRTLILQGCSFFGSIPSELGNLAELSFLSLSMNNFTGEIPPSLGSLTKLQWLDLGDNQLKGTIPISTYTSPGLDLLQEAKLLRLSGNRLSGSIPEALFSSHMKFREIMLNDNQFSGEIPSTLGLVQSLILLRLDGNSLSGSIPSNINNLIDLLTLRLADNKLSGSLPDFTGMNFLGIVDLSNNTFQESETPDWLLNLPSLIFVELDRCSLRGLIPPALFSVPRLQTVILSNNAFNGTLDLSHITNKNFQLIDFRNNTISSVKLNPKFKNSLLLDGNPLCGSALRNLTFCQPQN